MGVVFKARDKRLDRFVALKFLFSDRIGDPERHRRFVQEAKASSALNHPNVIHIYDIDEATSLEASGSGAVAGCTSEPVHFMAMEYVGR